MSSLNKQPAFLTREEADWLLHLLGKLTYGGSEEAVVTALEMKRSVAAKVPTLVAAADDGAAGDGA